MKYLIISVVLLSGCVSADKCNTRVLRAFESGERSGRVDCNPSQFSDDENRFIEAGKRDVEKMQQTEQGGIPILPEGPTEWTDGCNVMKCGPAGESGYSLCTTTLLMCPANQRHEWRSKP